MMLVYTSQYVKKNMKTKLGVEFEIDFAHTLRGHPKCGKPHAIHLELLSKLRVT